MPKKAYWVGLVFTASAFFVSDANSQFSYKTLVKKQTGKSNSASRTNSNKKGRYSMNRHFSYKYI